MNTVTNWKTGEHIERRMGDHEAAEICAKLDGDFPQSLAKKFPAISDCQIFWLHKYANDSLDPPKGVQLPEGAYRKLKSLFEKAATSLQYPKLRFVTPEGTIRITNFRGLRVRCGDRPCGKITEQDVFDHTPTCPEGVKETVKLIGKSPILMAIAFGRKIGHCCFCGLELTDARSTSMGYGPICADRWCLPWGEITDGSELLELVHLLENPRLAGSSGESSK